METRRQQVKADSGCRIIDTAASISCAELREFFKQSSFDHKRMLDPEAAKCAIGHRQSQDSWQGVSKFLRGPVEDLFER